MDVNVPAVFFDITLTFCTTEMVTQQSISLNFISFLYFKDKNIGLKKYFIISILSPIEFILFTLISPYIDLFFFILFGLCLVYVF